MVSLGGLLIKPYGAWSLIAIKAMNSVVPDAAISYGLFMEIMLPVSIVCFAAYIASAVLLLRLDVGKLASFKASEEKADFSSRTKKCALSSYCCWKFVYLRHLSCQLLGRRLHY